jgi:hypothetical protein
MQSDRGTVGPLPRSDQDKTCGSNQDKICGSNQDKICVPGSLIVGNPMRVPPTSDSGQTGRGREIPSVGSP